MGKKGSDTRDRILEVAERSILKKGFSATSIDDIIDGACITKGGFFYHFKGKNEMAYALVQRYLEQDDDFFNGLFERADSLSEDPLQQMLIFLMLLSEAMADLPSGHPGCLVASFIYQSLQFQDDVLQLIAQGVLGWRALFSGRLQAVKASYPMKVDASIDELADSLTSIIEGAIITSLVLEDPLILSKQLLQYRTYLRLLFNDV